MSNEFIRQNTLIIKLILTVFDSNSTKSIAIVGTSAIIALRKAFAIERSVLCKMNEMLSEVLAEIETKGFFSDSVKEE
jgi:hypothetical protein